MMASTISNTEERIAHLHNNVVLPSDDSDGHLILFDKYFFKNNKSLECKRRTCRGTLFHLNYI